MATKNIVPRGNNEGQLGTDEKRWNSVIAETASFTTLFVTKFVPLLGDSWLKSIPLEINILYEFL